MASMITRRFFSTTVRRMEKLQQTSSKQELQSESKRNPETFILGGVMVLALGGAGYYFGRSPTGATSEYPVNVAAMPWEGDAEGKYKYHPGGDPSAAPRDAPSALNTVIIPNVTAPKEAHDKFNKWGKEGYP